MSDLDLIRACALKAGEVALKRKRERLKVWSKEGGSPVTNADLEIDRLLKQELRAARPDYGWLSEETADDKARLTTRRQFVVDPIDGTVAFMKDRPWWSVCIAVVEDGRPVAGVVHAAALNETYEAEAGGGARLNGAPMSPSEIGTLEGCSIIADARYLKKPDWPEPWPDMRVESRNSVALRVALVGAGAFDAAVAMSYKCDWDLAAADLIATEAGALCTDHEGRTFTYNRDRPRQRSLVCAPPQLHGLILKRLAHIELN
ncbi:MAG TPA: 3'(2'),5'-bisphosphate nucleotidase CysQ [Caulobacteraceae bacterium]|jgi:myo-inositol-1(or 4)-monophosphatase